MGVQPRWTVWAAAFLAVASIWGLNYLFVRGGLALAAPLWLAFLRAGVGAAVASVFLLPRASARPLDRSARWRALLLGIPNTTLFFGLWFLAAGSILPGETAVIIYTFPFWVALLASPLRGSRVSAPQWLAVGVGFAGIVLISEPWRHGGPLLAPIAVAELLAAAVSWAIGTLWMQREFAADQILEANSYQLLGGASGLAIAAALTETRSVPTFSTGLLVDVLWLGVLGTAVAYSIWFYLLARVPAPTLSGFTFLVPVVALAASAVLFRERLDVAQIGGVAAVLAAIAANGWWSQRRESARAGSLGPPAPGATLASPPRGGNGDTGRRSLDGRAR